jgi:MinD-like ATPase involved in chromosome partitioning or flagellar assembly
LARVISVHSFRGGTGKSNLTANLAVALAQANHRVGVVDTDIQSPGVHILFQLDHRRTTFALNDFLWGRCSIQQAAHDVTASAIGDPERERPRIFLIPASISTGDIGRVLKEGYDVGLLNDGLKQFIRELALDYMLIDTHPGVNEETLLSIAISDVLIVVLRPDNQDFQGTAVTLELARRLDVPTIKLIVNKVPPGMDHIVLRQKVESTYNAEVAALLPLNHEIVRVASGGIFINRYPDHPFTREVKCVARMLMQ